MLTNRQGDYVTRICDICGNIKEHADYWSQYKRDTHRCYTCANKNTNVGRIPYNKGKREVPKHIGNIHAHSDGYPMVWIGASNGGYMPAHRLVASYEINRLVTRDEKVHHIDGIKTNYNMDNLFICDNMSHHRKVHSQLEKLSMELVSSGLIVFNKDIGRYAMNNQLIELYNKNTNKPPSDNLNLKDLVGLFYDISGTE